MSITRRDAVLIPPLNVPVVDDQNRLLPEWRRYFKQVEQAARDLQTLSTDNAALEARIAALGG